MNQIEYLDFDLKIEREGDRYRANAASPEGEVDTTFDRPFSKQEVGEFLTLVGYSSQDAHTVEEEAKKFGGRLFDTVFDKKIYGLLCRSVPEAKEQTKGLRIRLRLKDVPELADLPWEYLYDPLEYGFLCLSAKTPLVRYLERPERIWPFRVKGPLRFLVMISNPSDSKYSPLNVEKEWKQLNESLDSPCSIGQVELVRVEATASALQERLQLGTFHVFHFIGHGGFDEQAQDGFLVMSDNENPTLSGQGLGRLLHDHDTLRLVVLNACEGARGSHSNPFSGVAQSLVKVGIPAVIAMQFQITDGAAIKFSEEFYKAMANYYPVDAALAEARKALSMSKKRLEWGTPALYMRPSNGALFAEKDSPSSMHHEAPEEPDPYDPNGLQYGKIVKAILKGSVVPFLGARANLCDRMGDVGENLFPPSDDDLAAHLARIYHPPGEVKGLVRISQFFALRDTQELSAELYSALTHYSSVTSLHRFLADLPGILREKGYPFPYQLIVTTNYDDALERAFKAKNPKEGFDLIYYETEGKQGGRFCFKPWDGDAEPIKIANGFKHSLLEKRTVILKIHGDVGQSNPERRSYAVTEDDYIYYLSGKGINQFLPAQLIRKLQQGSQYLFLGYRLLDWNLRIFCRRVREDDKLPPGSWAIQSESDPLGDEFWNSRRTQIIRVSQEEFVNKLQMRLQALPRVGDV